MKIVAKYQDFMIGIGLSIAVSLPVQNFAQSINNAEKKDIHFVYFPQEVRECLSYIAAVDQEKSHQWTYDDDAITVDRVSTILHEARTILREKYDHIGLWHAIVLAVCLHEYEKYYQNSAHWLDAIAAHSLRTCQSMCDIWAQCWLPVFLNLCNVQTNIEVNGDLIVNSDAMLSGSLSITDTNTITGCSDGVLVVVGGVGIESDLNVCGNGTLGYLMSLTKIPNTSVSTDCTSGALVINGGVGIAGDLNVCGYINTDSYYALDSIPVLNATDTNVSAGFSAGDVTQGANNVYAGYAAGTSNIGNNNTFVGASGGASNTSGSNNVFLGQLAGAANTTASGNTFIGSNAGAANTIGTRNTYIGQSGGATASAASDNTFIGQNAGQFTQDAGISNTFIGIAAGAFNTVGRNNIYIGANAGRDNQIGSSNIIIGSAAGGTGGSRLVLIGDSAGASNRADDNIFIGHKVGLLVTAGQRNVYVGGSAASDTANATVSKNVYLGFNVGKGSGSNNVAIGARAAIRGNPAGSGVFIGRDTGNFIFNKSAQSTLVGSQVSNAVPQATCIGFQAGIQNNNNNGTGSITHFGSCAGQGQRNASNNVIMGVSGASMVNFDGVNNVILGLKAGFNARDRGVFIGNLAGGSAIDGVFIGYRAGNANNNFTAQGVFIGTNSGLVNNAPNNVFVGYDCGRSNGTGDSNVFIGSQSGITGGAISDAVAVGADSSAMTFSNAIVLGSGATANAARLVLGSAAHPLTILTTVGTGANNTVQPIPNRPVTYLDIRLNGSLYVIPIFNPA